MPSHRINRALALAGVASRRKAEQYIRDGRVAVNGRVVKDLATVIDTSADSLAVDGKPLILDREHRYYLYYKPRGVVSTMSDVSGRACVGDAIGDLAGAPRPVGRLDRRSEGLLLLTNDGELANQLAHPRYGVHKEYHVTVSPLLKERDAEQMTSGVPLADGEARFVGMRLLGQTRDRTRLAVVVDEGRNKLVRRVFGYFGHDVLRLKRVRLGSLPLGPLKPGEIRRLSASEVAQLRQSLKTGR